MFMWYENNDDSLKFSYFFFVHVMKFVWQQTAWVLSKAFINRFYLNVTFSFHIDTGTIVFLVNDIWMFTNIDFKTYTSYLWNRFIIFLFYRRSCSSSMAWENLLYCNHDWWFSGKCGTCYFAYYKAFTYSSSELTVHAGMTACDIDFP